MSKDLLLLLLSPKSCPTLCDTIDYSTPGFPVPHYLLEFAQTHVHWVSDAIQPSHPLSSPSPAFNLPSIRIFSNELALHIRWPKYWSFSSASILLMNIQDWFPLGWTGLISFNPKDSQESSPAPQFKSISYSKLSLVYGPTLTSTHDYWKNHSSDHTDLCQQSDVSAF